MNAAIKVLATQLAGFEAEYENLISAIGHAEEYDTPTHVKNLRLLAVQQWVRVKTTSDLIIELEKLNKVEA